MFHVEKDFLTTLVRPKKDYTEKIDPKSALQIKCVKENTFIMNRETGGTVS